MGKQVDERDTLCLVNRQAYKNINSNNVLHQLPGVKLWNSLYYEHLNNGISFGPLRPEPFKKIHFEIGPAENRPQDLSQIESNTVGPTSPLKILKIYCILIHMH